MNLEPYFKIDHLTRIYDMSSLKDNCDSEAKDLAPLIGSLRVQSYFSKGIFHNISSHHAEINSHIQNLKDAEEFLQECLNKL